VKNGFANYSEEAATKGKGNENPHAVSYIELSKEKTKQKASPFPFVYVCVCRGLDNAGKTTILKKFCGEDISTISPTLGFNIKTLEHGNYKLNIWDVGGQKSIRSYWRNYFEQTDAIVWVVDSADKRRMADCKAELHGLLLEEVFFLHNQI
jgi:hypothetical protein